MTFFKDFGFGLRTYSEALSFIFKKKLAWFFLFPIAFNILLFWFGWDLVSHFTETAKVYLENQLQLKQGDFWGSGFLKTAMDAFVWITFKVMFFLLFAYLGGYIIIILMSPIFSYLSERTEKIKTGVDYPFSIVQLLKDVLRGVLIAIRNFSIELLLTGLMFILSFIPIIGWFAAIMLFFISAYFYGFSFMDYALERKKLNLKQSVQFMGENKGIVIANGFVFSLCLIIPFCGVSFSSFAAIISVVAGTLAISEMDTRN
ncbi:CysZ protein [Ancylomarina subtilis]|uniref:CysZ protein n=1 Tax=Ancylomarina subtilis TaxID=1639035 RepID=A0A4Q7VKB0_9BACT|nr:EI24 domain-containing protein [Ancylomarina subtilis]RZT96681.1 CysZ protein [Ancylomarina subtilis]